MVTATLCHNHQ